MERVICQLPPLIVKGVGESFFKVVRAIPLVLAELTVPYHRSRFQTEVSLYKIKWIIYQFPRRPTNAKFI